MKTQHNPPAKEWFDMRELTLYASISRRTVLEWIRDPIDPLPAYRPKNKLLVSKHEFDAYVRRHRIPADESVTQIVDDILSKV